jgi:hypothetical protein
MAILESLTGALSFQPIRITTQTEWKDIDIVVTLTDSRGQKAVVAIEHKIKAREGKSQLEKYDEELANDKDMNVARKVFLTFLGDTPQGGEEWIAASYDKLFSGLDAASATCDLRYLKDYRDLVSRLLACHRLAIHEVAYAQCVFGDSANSDVKPCPGFVQYVEACKLRVTLQRAWLGEIINPVQNLISKGKDKWQTAIAETRGAGLLDFERDVNRQGKVIRYGLQLQNWRLKAFACPSPYKDKASEDERKAVEQLLNEISEVLQPSGKATRDRGRGFRSFSVGRERKQEERYVLDSWAEEISSKLRALEKIEKGAELT